MLKVFVINLADSLVRRERITERLNELGVHFELFEAINGRKNPHSLFARYDDELRKRFRGRQLSAGELGCFASHFLLWQRCIELNEAIIVMEDDVIISTGFVAAVAEAEPLIERLSYIRLAGTITRRQPPKKLCQLGSFELVEYIQGPSGALCYMIHPRAAKALVEHADVWYMAVDDYMDRYWCHQVECHALLPYTVTPGDNESDIVRVPKPKLTLIKKATRELFRMVESFRRLHYRFLRQRR